MRRLSPSLPVPVPAALGAALALCVSGCSLLGPGPRRDRPGGGASSRTATAAAVVRAERTHELPTPVPASSGRVTRGWATPRAAVATFAATYVNWTAGTVASRLRGLARESVGQARAELTIEASQVSGDRELAEGEIANRGTVEAVARLPGAGDRWVVVTRERTTSSVDAAYRGLAAQWHVSVATVTRVAAGSWVLSAWQPEN